MDFAEILGSKSKQQNNNSFNEIALIFRLWSKPLAVRNDSLY